MTSAELAACRHLPIHVQTMRRPSLVTRGAWVYSDLEEFTPANLDASVTRLRQQGWTESGPRFIRTRPQEPTP